MAKKNAIEFIDYVRRQAFLSQLSRQCSHGVESFWRTSHGYLVASEYPFHPKLTSEMAISPDALSQEDADLKTFELVTNYGYSVLDHHNDELGESIVVMDEGARNWIPVAYWDSSQGEWAFLLEREAGE